MNGQDDDQLGEFGVTYYLTRDVYVRDDDGKPILRDGTYAMETVAIPPEFYLPHQCDEWGIGGVDEMRRFIAECRRALAEAIVQQRKRDAT